MGYELSTDETPPLRHDEVRDARLDVFAQRSPKASKRSAAARTSHRSGSALSAVVIAGCARPSGNCWTAIGLSRFIYDTWAMDPSFLKVMTAAKILDDMVPLPSRGCFSTKEKGWWTTPLSSCDVAAKSLQWPLRSGARGAIGQTTFRMRTASASTKPALVDARRIRTDAWAPTAGTVKVKGMLPPRSFQRPLFVR